MESIPDSELILNADGSIYHLNLLPGDCSETIITVGDQERVGQISKHFDSIELKKGKREFSTHTGWYKGHRISVISTGIGTDNIDIVFNELDALFNIDFTTRKPKSTKTKLKFIRIGTSGAFQKDIAIDSYLLTKKAIGIDALLHFYETKDLENKRFKNALHQHLNWAKHTINPYVFDGSNTLSSLFKNTLFKEGCTVTSPGFYGPQGRILQLQPKLKDFFETLSTFEFEGERLTNLEMETAGIYGLAKLLGHEAISLNAILANRANGTFSKTPQETVEKLIVLTLDVLTK
ncbi:phosphorylase [Croceivirga lutea]|uniref:nucleoside phosphorylase n=1 Tax=Croceivirga lutea TaxID=1775167 RepID=UPI001639E2F8|nr:nucleoside phosphorylase [Croceivirga lutea]GGG45639.1 phosphorylase [Croceivirga lutea]